jgi:protein TonB
MIKAPSLLAGYGNFELKRVYRKNMTIGMLVACALHLIIIGGVVLISHISTKPPEAAGTIVLRTAADLGTPPTLSAKDIPVRVVAPERAQPSVGVPTPVPDEEAPEEVDYVTQDELAVMAAPPPITDLGETGDKEIIIYDLDELLPEPDEFIAYEEAPVQIEVVTPEYPEMARRASIEGIVWVKALVDKEGRVRDVIIVRDSGAKAGFEEAAIEAAKKTFWKPAISNGQPVAVWVAYKIEFKLK